jgi:hypothetical protein
MSEDRKPGVVILKYGRQSPVADGVEYEAEIPGVPSDAHILVTSVEDFVGKFGLMPSWVCEFFRGGGRKLYVTGPHAPREAVRVSPKERGGEVVWRVRRDGAEQDVPASRLCIGDQIRATAAGQEVWLGIVELRRGMMTVQSPFETPADPETINILLTGVQG